MEIILASKSPARREILERLGFRVLQIPAEVEEARIGEASLKEAVELAVGNALKKAEKIAERYPGKVVVAADTLVYFEDRILGKPRNEEEARRFLLELKDKWHKVLSGYAVCTPKGFISGYEVTEVKMRNYREEEVEYYLSTGEYKGKAGGYAIQGLGAFLVEEVRGCFYNVAGLPLARIVEALLSLGYWPPLK